MSAAVYRRAAASDAAALSLLGQATFLESYAGLVDGTDILAHCRRAHAFEFYAGWLADPAVSIWVAETETRPMLVGYAVLGPSDLDVPRDETDIEIRRLYLLHRFHGTGIGRALLGIALEQARGLGMARTLLGVLGVNERALRFYRKAGFVQAGVRKYRVGAHDYDDLVLARPLA